MHRPGVLVRSVLALLLATLCFQADGGGMQDMVAAALQYVSSGNAAEPASPPAPAPMPARHSALGPGSAPPARNISVTNSFAQAQPPPERTRSLPNSTLPFCSSSLQLTQLTGVCSTSPSLPSAHCFPHMLRKSVHPLPCTRSSGRKVEALHGGCDPDIP